jgi:hypothetical protein
MSDIMTTDDVDKDDQPPAYCREDSAATTTTLTTNSHCPPPYPELPPYIEQDTRQPGPSSNPTFTAPFDGATDNDVSSFPPSPPPYELSEQFNETGQYPEVRTEELASEVDCFSCHKCVAIVTIACNPPFGLAALVLACE